MAFIAIASGWAQPLPAQGNDPKAVHLATTYQTRSIGGAYLFVIEGVLGGFGIVLPDPIECVVDEFGVQIICTEMIPFPIDVEISQLDLQNPRYWAGASFLSMGICAQRGRSTI